MLLRFFLTFCFLSVILGTARSEGASLPEVRRTVDSLNELAFRVKRNNINEAVTLLFRAGQLAKENNYQRGLSVNLLYEAGIYQQYGYHKKALSLYYKSREISIRNNDTLNTARANQQIGFAFSENHNQGEAEKLYKQAMDAYILLDRKEDIINMQNAIGVIALTSSNMEEAHRYFSAAEKGSASINYAYGIKKTAYNMGLLLVRNGRLNEARSHFEHALELNSGGRTDYYGMSQNKNKLSMVARMLGRNAEAEQLALSAFNDAQTISAMRLMTDAVESLLAVYEKEDRPDKVIRWQKILIQEQNKIFEKEREYAIEFLDLLKARQEEQALAEAKTLEAQQRARYSGIIALIVSIALAVLSGLAYLLAKNYQKVKSYSKNLGEKNALIGKQIGELKALNEAIMHQNSRLEESNLMKNKLLSIISHDLRTPLVNTKGMLEFINEGLIDPEEREQVFRDLENQYVTVITLLDNLLFWIKGQMESDDFQVASIEIRHLIEQVIREQEVSLKNKGVIAVNEVAPGLTVDGHLEMLKVVFRNLLSNAIKFTDSGSIRFYSSVGEGVSVHVKDAGVGMSAEVLQKVRNRAYFTTPGTKKEAGSGFGLMICKDIISKHDGDLLIDSEPGAGSVFSVKLPLKSRKEKARRQQEIVEN